MTSPHRETRFGLDHTGDVRSSPLSADQALDALYRPPPEVIAAKEAAVAKQKNWLNATTDGMYYGSIGSRAGLDQFHAS